jgi:hypothetical protein
MSRIDITTSAAPLSDGMLQTANPLDATLQVVTDNVGNSSTVSLSTTETQINSILRIKTDNAELLDIENSSGNRFNINRDVQKVNLDFASNPTGSTSIVGAIRTFIDGTNLSDVAQFQENGQVTFTERLKLESDSTVTTQTSSVIQSSTLNASLVIAPNGTGALVADIPDGAATGGNARGANAVDLQMNRIVNTQVALGIYSVIAGGEQNTAAANLSTVVGGRGNTAGDTFAFVGGGASNAANTSYSTVSGGQSNTASTNTHATVVGGQSNVSSGTWSTVLGGQNNSATNSWSIAGGLSNTASGQASVVLGYGSFATNFGSIALSDSSLSYLASQVSIAAGTFSGFPSQRGEAQQSLLTARRSDVLTTAATTVLSLDNTGVTNLIIPNGNNRAWNVQVNWVAIVSAITGTATGITVGDVVTSIDLLAFKKIGGISSASAHTSTATKLMVTTPAAYAACAIAYTAGASQEMALTFTGPSFAGAGSVTMRVVARIELTEVAF